MHPDIILNGAIALVALFVMGASQFVTDNHIIHCGISAIALMAWATITVAHWKHPKKRARKRGNV
jgi:hypothetical protein